MTFSFGSMIRLTVLLLVALTLLAIGVARLSPLLPARRTPRAVTDYSVNEFYFPFGHRLSRWLDSETGVMSIAPLPAEDLLEEASTSPWVDESGHRQVVGLWSSRTYRGTNTLFDAVGLARYSFPDGRLLDHVPADVVPAGPPCWLPGTRARVIFAAGNGQLYRFGFEPDGPPVAADAPAGPVDLRPTPLTWMCPKPGTGRVLIGDISWPTDPRLGGRLLASIRQTEVDARGKAGISPMQLWWLRLDTAATRILAAGPLVLPDLGDASSPTPRPNFRSAVAAALPDGSLGLAYARQVGDEPNWSIRLARLAIDADHRPVAGRDSAAREVATGCRPAPLGFSSDGRWLAALDAGAPAATSAVRFPTSAAAASRPGPGRLAAGLDRAPQ